MSVRAILLNYIAQNPHINARYQVLKCVNFHPTHGRRGCFSLVFEALDNQTKRKVALKFFDPDVGNDPYRIAAFQREPELLQKVIGNEKCLQLFSIGLETFTISATVPGLGTIPFNFDFFAVEWLDYDIDDFFQLQDSVESLSKLFVFKNIVSAVSALHRVLICHRDLKVDNLRASKVNRIKRNLPKDGIIKVIDLGTAARFDSPRLQAQYTHPVGARAYSSPEAFAGLAGSREIGRPSDIYALGCLLFELFNVATLPALVAA